MTHRLSLLASAALLFPWQAHAQQATPPSAPSTATPPSTDTGAAASSDDEDEQVVTVTGQKPRGSVIGDIPPENTLTTRDIRATGATSIQELLDAIAPETGTARGRSDGPPVLLLNGLRISGFRELRDIPPEAIERLEILPEEVALKYGFSADQRVVNIVLRQRFDATTANLQGKAATDGHYQSGSADVSKLVIRNGKRTNVTLHSDANTPLYETQRPVTDPEPFRTLTASNADARLSAVINRPLSDVTSLTIAPEVSITHGVAGLGRGSGILTPPNDDPIRRIFDTDPLYRRTDQKTAALGATLNSSSGKWHWSAVGNGEVDWNRTHGDRGPDFSTLNAELANGTATFDPLGDLGPLTPLPTDVAHSTVGQLSGSVTANGPLIRLPAGLANVTLKAGGSYNAINGYSDRYSLAAAGVVHTDTSLSRTEGDLSANVDLPLTRANSGVGRLTGNLNAAVSQLSDAGTLTTLGAGLNWTPVVGLSLIGSFTRDENAPTINQLGDPVLTTAGVPYFDAVTGQTVDVTTISGGNPALRADRRNVFKLGANWKPFTSTDLRLRADFVHQTVDNPQLSFPAVSAAIEQAFPDRFVRDSSGQLVQVDLRPINAESSTRDTLRIGFDFSKSLKSKPPTAEQIAALRARFRRNAPQVATPANGAPANGAAQPAGGPPAGDGARGGSGRFGGGGGGRFGGGGGRFGGGSGGRLTFSLTDTITFVDKVALGPNLPTIDYLHGAPLGGSGGQPRHTVEAQAGYYNNGLGLRASADYRTATDVTGGNSGDLHFSPYATFDLSAFVNVGERFDVVTKHPFFLGSSIRFQVSNLFNARPQVTGGNGLFPTAYDPYRLQPIGRTVGITFRKLFLPTPFFRMGGGGFGGRGPGGPPPPGGGDGPPPPPPPSDSGGGAPPPPPPAG
ncbi:TonB-dependent receptor [Sphingomonas sp. ASV193]|uniref:TonB-dependent receptor n=1 Tax=Sphingomonas sp. ASV193 TaxID=3144405 RepID=UPI0032E8D4C3